MNTNWQQFLTEHGAMIDADIVQHFGNPTTELRATADGNVMAELSQFGALRVSGEDAQSFLQNLFSNDIRTVTATQAQLSSFNSAKGRMLASLLVYQDGADYVLQLPRSLSDMLRKKLSMYVLRSKVKITDVSDELVAIGVSGKDVADKLAALFGALPTENLGVVSNETTLLIRWTDTRFQLMIRAEQAAALWQSLNLTPVGSACWDWLTIQAGIPVILPATQEQFVAQMVNFEQLGGVNFKKGCYPGQEIVARMQYLGKLKRRMYRGHLTSPAQVGDELFSADMAGQASGMVVNVAPAPDGGYDLLAVLQISSRETQSIHWQSLEGEVIQLYADA
ncbi:MAG: folate-binding protein [Gallionella sp.]|nr:folate-binding protein [Gallionella sp.]MDD4959478.1 folate-binding protein [Gallionella sp.]